MKLFQVKANVCYLDVSGRLSNKDITITNPSEKIFFVEAPDYVFEGWGYDIFAEGDNRFIKPTPPEGWFYDDATGTFYQGDILTKTDSN